MVEVGGQLLTPGVQGPPEAGQLLDRALTQRRDQLGGRGAGRVGIIAW